jgi:hypothetical protein
VFSGHSAGSYEKSFSYEKFISYEPCWLYRQTFWTGARKKNPPPKNEKSVVSIEKITIHTTFCYSIQHKFSIDMAAFSIQHAQNSINPRAAKYLAEQFFLKMLVCVI